MLCRTKDDPSNGGVRSGAPTGGSASEAADRAHAAEVHRFNDAMTERYGRAGGPTDPAGWFRDYCDPMMREHPVARNYAVARLAADVGLRINEARMLDLDDVRWELGRFGKLNARHGKGSRRRGPKARLVPLINGADRSLRWFIEDVLGHFDADPTRHGAPLFPSERKAIDGSSARATADVFRRSLAEAATAHLPTWDGKLTPHVLRHFCASRLYLAGMNLFAIQELLGHAWTGTTARYIHVHASHVEDAWVAGQERASTRWEGLT